MRASIGSKVLGLFAIVALVGLAIFASSFRTTSELAGASSWVTHTYKVIAAYDEVRSLVKDAESSQRGYVITGEERFLEPYQAARTKMNDAIALVKKLTEDNPSQQKRLELLKAALDKKEEFMSQTIRARRDGGFNAARTAILTDVGRTAMEQIKTYISEGVEEENALLEKRDATNAEYMAITKGILFGGVLIFIAMFAVTALFVRKRIVRPLGEVMGLANSIASGDLRPTPLKIESKDEIGELATIFNSMMHYLRSMALQNADIARNLATAASEILAAIQQQAAAAREQATAIQQTTTTMEEVGQSGAQVSERGRQISSSAESTLVAANAGIGAVQSTNVTMINIRSQVESVAENILNLSDRNQTIGEIISSVNNIAEQSNLLALNAAIEASDAGEHGRRFAVVANEMKNLADQAKNATVQVRSILGEIQKGINSSVMLTEEAVKRAESGKQQADLAERTIIQLTGTTNDSVKTFQQIIGATNQQQIGFEQITQALRAIRIGAEQTAASTNQLEKAALSLNGLGQQLQKNVEGYKT
ncbi:MAG: HAMP domain-containing protein [Proteobacteria bacterium]|nr:MAG: HAMP domain-containing protein [Pseudomonadota bacterium]